MIYAKFRGLLPIIADKTIKQLTEQEKPVRIKKNRLIRFALWLGSIKEKIKTKFRREIELPNDLNNLTIGEYLYLCNQQGENYLLGCFAIVLHLDKAEVMALPVEQVFGFSNWCRTELERISNLFEQTKIEPTLDEKQAGIEELNKAGSIGLLDYLSKRQRCSLQDAEKIKWQTAYALMMIDKRNELFRRNLQNRYLKKS